MSRLRVWRVKVTGVDGRDRLQVFVTRATDPAPIPGAELLTELDGVSSIDLWQFLPDAAAPTDVPPLKPRSVRRAEQR